MSETNRIEYKRELTSELDIEKEVVADKYYIDCQVYWILWDVMSVNRLICIGDYMTFNIWS